MITLRLPRPSIAAATAAALAASSLVALAAPRPASAAEAPPAGVLSLSASASVEVPRDIVAITFSTSRDGADANAVQAQLKAALDAALAEAKKAARPGQIDVSTGNFQLFPRYATARTSSTGTGGITGWQGSAELVVQGRDIAGIGQLAGRITTMSVARITQRLSRESQEKVEGDVAAEAIARFRAKAAEYAKQFGYAGGVAVREVNVQTSDAAQPMPMMRMQASVAAASSDALSVETGKATVTANVSGTVQMSR